MDAWREPLLGDLKSFQERVIALRHAIIADGVSNGVPFHEKDLQTLTERSKSEGASFVKVTLPLLGRALDLGLVTGHFKCPANFAMKRNTCLPMFLYGCFATIFDHLGLLRSRPSTTVIYYSRQFLLLDAKLISEPTPMQREIATQGFKDRQSALRKKHIPSDHPVLLRAQMLLGDVLRSLDIGDIAPGHGPGAVAEKLDREERWDFRSWPLKAEREYPYIVYGTHSMRASLERGHGIHLLKEMNTRCVLVPKDFRGPRLISAEPAINQYLQQGQMKAIMQYVDRHEVLSRSLKLRDQTRNQRLAQNAHEEGLATLDLSDASDTVSTTLVWYLLSKVPATRRRLMSTRSDNLIMNNGDKVKIVAFAPMGSAVCFPVESLVFWSLTMASLMLVRPRRRETHDEWIRELSSSIGVFGDDIIVPDEALDILIGTLETVGCKPNMSKTCRETPFRESCGTEWMNNTDVTIIRNRRYYYEDRSKLSDHPVLTDLNRKFFLRGLYRTAKLIGEWASESYPTVQLSIACLPRFGEIRARPRSNADLFDNEVGQVYSLVDESRGVKSSVSRRQAYRRSYVQWNVICTLYQEGPDAFFERQSLAVDSFPVLFGFDTVITNSVVVRWNKNYQRLEFRVPRDFHVSRPWCTEGYTRLFARNSSDLMERIAKRDRKIKLAWSYLPIATLLSKS